MASQGELEKMETEEYYHLQSFLFACGYKCGTYLTPISDEDTPEKLAKLMHMHALACVLQLVKKWVCTLASTLDSDELFLTSNTGFSEENKSRLEYLFSIISEGRFEEALEVILAAREVGESSSANLRDAGESGGQLPATDVLGSPSMTRDAGSGGQLTPRDAVGSSSTTSRVRVRSKRRDEQNEEEEKKQAGNSKKRAAEEKQAGNIKKRAADRMAMALGEPPLVGDFSQEDLREWLTSSYCLGFLRPFAVQKTLKVCSDTSTTTITLSLDTLDSYLRKLVPGFELSKLKMSQKQKYNLSLLFNNKALQIVRHSECQSRRICGERCGMVCTTKLLCATCSQVFADCKCRVTGSHGEYYPVVEAPYETIHRFLPKLREQAVDCCTGKMERGQQQSQDALYHFLLQLRERTLMLERDHSLRESERNRRGTRR